jgi:hypothetical protein
MTELRRVPLMTITLVLAACSGFGGGPQADGPRLLVGDSVVMQEPEGDGLYMPLRNMVRLSDGQLLADIGTAIDQFDPSGQFVRRIGGPGNGPGEFVRISTILALPGEIQFAAVDARRGKILVFEVATGGLVREVPVRPFFPGQQWRWVGDTVVMPSKLSPTPFTSWVPASDSVWSWGTVPEIFTTSMQAYTQGGEPSLARYDAGWLAVYPGDGRLFVLDAQGEPLRTLDLPVRGRRGVPAALADSVAAIAQSGGFRYASSLVYAIWELPNGNYGLVHMDTDVQFDAAVYEASQGRGGIGYSNMNYWVSVVTRDLSKACVDARVPFTSDNLILPFVRADSLYFLTRAVGTDSTATAVLHPFRVDDEECRWIPLDVPQ